MIAVDVPILLLCLLLRPQGAWCERCRWCCKK